MSTKGNMSKYSAPVDEAACGSGEAITNGLGCFGLSEPEVDPEEEARASATEYHYDFNKSKYTHTLAARDSLALQEMGSVISEEFHADELTMEGEKAGRSETGARRRRSLLRIALLSVLVVAIVLATVLTRTNRKDEGDSQPPVVVSRSETGVDASPAPEEAAPEEAAPEEAAPEEATMQFQILKPYVNDTSKLLDPDTPQGKAFQQLLTEDVIAGTDFDHIIKQRYAMMVTYFSLGGENWAWQSGWSDFSENECYWHGVSICRYRNGKRIAAGLRLAANGLTGELPEEICMMEYLETILLENNQIVGQLPSCLTNLSSVFEIDVHNNNLSGAPPSGFLDMPDLEKLDLSQNSFSGDLDFLLGPQTRNSPTGLIFSKVTTLHLDNNEFDGDIPDLLSKLGSLQELTLHQTDLSGDASAICGTPSVSVLTFDCSQMVCDGECCTCE